MESVSRRRWLSLGVASMRFQLIGRPPVQQLFAKASTASRPRSTYTALCVSLPHALGKSLQLLCERDPQLDVHDLLRPMPPCGRKGNRRDLLPLMLSARPPCKLAESESARSAEGVSARETWVRVMVCVLNWQYCGESVESTLARHGPVSGLQRDALDRLYGLAHSFVQREIEPCHRMD